MKVDKKKVFSFIILFGCVVLTLVSLILSIIMDWGAIVIASSVLFGLTFLLLIVVGAAIFGKKYEEK